MSWLPESIPKRAEWWLFSKLRFVRQCKRQYNQPEVMVEYGVYVEYIRVLSEIIFYLLQDVCKYMPPFSGAPNPTPLNLKKPCVVYETPSYSGTWLDPPGNAIDRFVSVRSAPEC